MNMIIAIYYKNKSRYGYRRVHLELKNQGFCINRKKVQRLMNKMDLLGCTPRSKYKSYKGDLNGTCRNLLLNKTVDKEKHVTKYIRDFSTTGCNQKWVTDITEFHIAIGKLYVSVILDVFNGEVIACDISYSPKFDQVERMIKEAFIKHQHLNGLIIHSDQGWQYQMKIYQTFLLNKGVLQSMSRKGNCYDNSVMENFFGILKQEMFF